MKLFDIAKLNRRINTIENENETLKKTIKNDLYTKFMNKLDNEVDLDRLKKENKKLRAKFKSLKDIIKEG